MRISKGTNRFCIITKKFTYKLPISKRGKMANENEYKNYLENKNVVAYTEKHWYGLRQETLTNIVIYKKNTSYVDIKQEHKHLYVYSLNNRMQIGLNKLKEWKFFDYEDVKYYL